MGLLVPPYLQNANDRKQGDVSVNFTYDFTPDASGPVTVGGYPLVGKKYTLDISSVQNVANISAIRALQVTINFNSFTIPSGPLFIVSQNSGQVICLANHITPQTAAIRNPQIVSAIVPIVCTAQSKIDFIKVSDQNSNAMSGVIWVTAFNFDMPAYAAMSQG